MKRKNNFRVISIMIILISIIQIIISQDKSIIKEDQQYFKTIIEINNPDSLNSFYVNCFLPNKLVDFAYGMQMYFLTNKKTIKDQLISSMPQNKLEFLYFYTLTENIFDDTALNVKLNYFVNKYDLVLSDVIPHKSESEMKSYLIFFSSLEGEIAQSYAPSLVNTFKSNSALFILTFYGLNSKSKEKIFSLLKYGGIDFEKDIPVKEKMNFKKYHK